MSKSKTNALDTLRGLIAERQQYDQWIATLESKRDGTPEEEVEFDVLTGPVPLDPEELDGAEVAGPIA